MILEGGDGFGVEGHIVAGALPLYAATSYPDTVLDLAGDGDIPLGALIRSHCRCLARGRLCRARADNSLAEDVTLAPSGARGEAGQLKARHRHLGTVRPQAFLPPPERGPQSRGDGAGQRHD